MNYSARLSKLSNNKGLIEFHQEVNTERLRTMYDGDIRNIQMDVTFPDPRRFTVKQRSLMFALFNDIHEWSMQDIGAIDTDIPIEIIGTPETIKDIFYSRYILKYHKDISVRNESTTTVSEMNNLLDIILDFMFEWGVPFSKGHDLLPKNEQFYLYQCLKHRKCAVCGKHADVHHIDTVGAGNNRNKIDHTKKLVIALCREHHNEAHNTGNKEFLESYHLSGIYADYDTFNKLGLMSQKLIDELTGKGEF